MRPVRAINPPLIGALLVNGMMLTAMIGLGVGGPTRQAEESSLKVISLAVVRGEEEEKGEAPSQPVPMPASRPEPSHRQTVEVASALLPPPVVTLAAVPVAAPGELYPPPSSSSATGQATPADAAASGGGARKGARDGADIDAPTGHSRSYAARVRSWLLSHKTYPKRARMRRQTGIVVVHFIIDRQGRLVRGMILSSSGCATLDEEVMAMLQRAAPYPAAPPDLTGEHIGITAPVEFLLPV